MINFWVNLALNLAPREAPKIHKKRIENKMQGALEFGTLLGRIWVDFGSNLGAKLDPSWHQNPKK